MTHTTIGKTFTFEAAHHLEHHRGKCRRPHGHSYKLEVMVTGAVKPVLSGLRTTPAVVSGSNVDRTSTMPPWADAQGPAEEFATYASDVGMVMDFATLSEIVHDRVIDAFDHRDLNLVCGVYPTAELLARTILERIAEPIAQAASPERPAWIGVRLYETATSYAECSIVL